LTLYIITNSRIFKTHTLKATTLFDKVWDAHVVEHVEGGPNILYIDKHLIHEVTSPQAFSGLEKRGLKVFRPERTIATPDHNVPTVNQHLLIVDKESRAQVETLKANCEKNKIEIYDLNHPNNGIVHVVGPEMGHTQPGMTMVCGDSHTSTHGAFGAVAFGIGTSEVEMVFATQCIMQSKPKKMRITIEGDLAQGISAKDLTLYVIAQLGTGGATGYFVEYAGSAVRSLSMEGRMTVCNMSIEMGARGGMIAPDETTFEYIKGRTHAPKDEAWDDKLAYWKTLKSDEGSEFDKEYCFKAEDIEPMITYGTNPGMGMGIAQSIPSETDVLASELPSIQKSLAYMDYQLGTQILGKKVDYVFVGSCTNGRIEDIRAFAALVVGHKKADSVTAWIVPGSKKVEKEAIEEGLVDILKEAGFEFRQPGCSACLAMNDDKVPAGKYCVSTSNRNFEGRQGPGSRTLLASPLTAAAAAITGVITDPREFM